MFSFSLTTHLPNRNKLGQDNFILKLLSFYFFHISTLQGNLLAGFLEHKRSSLTFAGGQMLCADQEAVTEEAKGEPRLVISQMILDNFKSYCGRHVIGPFHKVQALSIGTDSDQTFQSPLHPLLGQTDQENPMLLMPLCLSLVFVPKRCGKPSCLS